MPLIDKEIGPRKASLLNYGNHVINLVRARIPQMGNQQADRHGSNFPEYMAKRAYEVMEMAKKEHDVFGFKPKLLAGIAAKYEAGNCDMAAAMSYTILRAHLTDDFEVILKKTSNHTFAGFRQIGAPDTEIVIVDPWPPSGMATLFEDYAFQQGTEVVLCKPGKRNASQEPRDRVELNEKYAGLGTFIEKDIAKIVDTMSEQAADGVIPFSESSSSSQGPVYNVLLSSNTVRRYLSNGQNVSLPSECLTADRLVLPALDNETAQRVANENATQANMVNMVDQIVS